MRNKPEMKRKIEIEASKQFDQFMKKNKEIYQEVLIQISNLEDLIDCDKIRKIIYDEIILDEMNDIDFEDYRQRLFNTNITFFEKAIDKSKTGNNLNAHMEIEYAN